MKVVVDTSPCVFLCKMGRLDLLKCLYSELYTTSGVIKELQYPEDAVKFVKDNFTVVSVDEGECDKCGREMEIDGAEVEVYVAYCNLAPDEMLLPIKGRSTG